MKYTYILIGLCISSVTAVVVVASYVQGSELPEITHGEIAVREQSFAEGSLFFVGDIMLGRRVETLSNAFGLDYAFQATSTQGVLRGEYITVGNLEGPVPQKHVHTPDLTFRFSMQDEFLPELKRQGFDVLSLANNHTFDHGVSGYEHTLLRCALHGLTCGGNPNTISSTSRAYVSVGDTRVGIIFIHAVTEEPHSLLLADHLVALKNESDVQIAYVHWGDEYALAHNASQEVLATKLIDGGVDVIFGHHPHVVQDIGWHTGKPIFYSLGNFIFDQYFSDDVQEGIGVRMDIKEKEIVYTMVPFESHTVRSQPRIYEGEGAYALLARIRGEDVGVHGSATAEIATFSVPR